jgi:hypothetical protein
MSADATPGHPRQRALVEAARAGDVGLVRNLLGEGADPNGRAGTDRFDDPPLAYAVECGSLECAIAHRSVGAIATETTERFEEIDTRTAGILNYSLVDPTHSIVW